MASYVDLVMSHHGKVSDKWSSYLAEYEKYFLPYRDLDINLLEVGVQNGGSLEIYSKYFKRAKTIIGCDVNNKCSELIFYDSRISVIIGDINLESTKAALFNKSKKFDLIIDDGSHSSADIVRTFLHLFPALEDGGLYVIEDLHCSYWSQFDGGLFNPNSSLSFLKMLSDVINYEHWGVDYSAKEIFDSFSKQYNVDIDEDALLTISSIEFRNSLCAVRKGSQKNSIGKRVVVGEDEFVVAGHKSLANRDYLLEVTQDRNIWSLIESDPNRKIDNVKWLLAQRDQQLKEADATIKQRDQQLKEADATIKQRDQQLKEADATIKQRDQQLNDYHDALCERDSRIRNIYASKSWRITASLRKASLLSTESLKYLKLIKVELEKNHGQKYKLIKKVVRIFREGGVSAIYEKLQSRAIIGGLLPNDCYPINVRIKSQLQEVEDRFLSAADINLRQDKSPIISILMPVYKPPISVLSAAIESVIGQSSSDWELIIVDDNSNDDLVRALLIDYSEKDSRIKVKFSKENRGISSATNIALEISRGDFIGLLDNDDLLTNDAIATMIREISTTPDVDILYSDECKIDKDGKPVEIFCKPEWSPILLFNCMYLGHFCVYRTSIVKSIGGFRSQYDFSQDYDLALRASEKARTIIHVEKVLYGWRMLDSSAAAGGKPLARITNIAALQNAMDRRGLKAIATPLIHANRALFDTTNFNDFVSIIIPSDNAVNIQAVIRSVQEKTLYKVYEIIVVTNSKIIKRFSGEYKKSKVIFVTYDKKYNFSDKCNAGAEVANGSQFIFLNDDVRIISDDWIEALLEYLKVPGVGVVGPKLLYENGTIQHAGMVVGTRRLVGTAFHSLPEQTTMHYNFAQSAREVSVICGACLAISKKIFEEIKGFDSTNFPINHSDVDLCFKVRSRGYTCVYTPYAKLMHIGHMSLGSDEVKSNQNPFAKDKSDISLLKIWPHYISSDPYFTNTMRNNLYHDSQEAYEIFIGCKSMAKNLKKDILIVSNDLSESGAPKIVYDLVKILMDSKMFVVVTSPSDGPMRKRLELLGVTVIVDELCISESSNFFDFAKNFDAIIFNTIVVWRPISRLFQHVDIFWYIHESDYAVRLIEENQEIKKILNSVKWLCCGSKRAYENLKQYRNTSDVNIIPYGIEALTKDLIKIKDNSPPHIIRIFGSYEYRKGQDLLLDALGNLTEDLTKNILVEFYGRTLDVDYYDKLKKICANLRFISLHQNVSHEEYLRLLEQSFLVIIPSRDDTLPLVSLDALALGVPILVTPSVGTSQYLKNGYSGFIAKSTDSIGLLEELRLILSNKYEIHKIIKNGQMVFLENFSMTSFKNAVISLLTNIR
ncbi:glycosyltransferase [Polynucleobacter sp. UK-Kesae-W10]|uniref:glycosyltransferase n=1 Tax=Polynucleobacter sp. UK-Kesae-W10 TaxID=1819738 RepID=UPI001C0D6824|nr:glycosyltransferase [Polynucleobacter sp. UK-Kesae-W10]MBU3576951.1 glycosyltransferase [Polynucleobacter sp. UK-Kesae-W10]